MELVCGGSDINRAYPVCYFSKINRFCQPLKLPPACLVSPPHCGVYIKAARPSQSSSTSWSSVGEGPVLRQSSSPVVGGMALLLVLLAASGLAAQKPTTLPEEDLNRLQVPVEGADLE